MNETSRPRRATQKDIADALGVTVTTVSKSLRNHPDVSARMRARVLAQSQSMNYSPNVLAQSLRKNTSTFVPVVITDIADPYFADIIKGADYLLKEHGYDILIFDNKDDPDIDFALVTKLRGINPAGVILTPASCGSRSVAALADAGIPYVLANRYIEGGQDNYVVADDVRAAFIGAEHLIVNRSRKVILANGSMEVSCAIDRLAGYRQALQEYGIEFRQSQVYFDCNDQQDGYEAAKRIFDEHEPPFAILGYSDFVASGIVRFALETGVAIPGSVAVMGIDNIDFYSFTHPSLSTVNLAAEQIGREASDLLLRIIADRGATPRQIVLQPKLVVRESA